LQELMILALQLDYFIDHYYYNIIFINQIYNR